MDNESIKSDIKRRLNKIEGQVRGIQRMIDADEGCADILVQIAAVRSAINKVGGIILENHTKACIKAAVARCDEKAIDELVNTIINFTKYNEIKE